MLLLMIIQNQVVSGKNIVKSGRPMGQSIMKDIRIPIQPNAPANNQREVNGFLCGSLSPPSVPSISNVWANQFVGNVENGCKVSPYLYNNQTVEE